MAQTQAWPPIPWLWRQYNENGAWYSGDPAKLAAVSGFWKSREKAKYHIPVAADIAALAAGFIFSGSPIITSDDELTNERLQEIMEQSGFYQMLLRGAELQSAYGGVFLKLNWDKSLADHPIVAALPGSAGLPEFKYGINIKNTFWTEVRREEDTMRVYRRREEYTRDGRIINALFRGNSMELGTEVPLDSIDETRGTAKVAQSGTDKLLSVYIPGRLPNKHDPMSPYGASDYEGLHDLFDALDETYSALMRDIRLGKARLIVPMDYLRRKESIRAALEQDSPAGWVYPDEQEYFVALDIDPQDKGSPITAVQPEVRGTQYLEVINDQVRRIYMAAGFSPQSAGLDIAGSAESGTALNVRERRSMQTTEAKKTYWWHALVDFVQAMIALDAKAFTPSIKPDAPITVAFADNTQPDTRTIADILQQVSAAGAASTQTKVQILHPDWDQEKIDEEVVRIMDESDAVFNRYLAGQGAGAIAPEELRARIMKEDAQTARENLPQLAEETHVVGE